jgi:hypothetical protein
MLSLEIMAECLSMSAVLKLTSWLKFAEIQFTEARTVFKGVMTFYQYFPHILIRVGAMWYTISRLMSDATEELWISWLSFYQKP